MSRIYLCRLEYVQGAFFCIQHLVVTCTMMYYYTLFIHHGVIFFQSGMELTFALLYQNYQEILSINNIKS